jgi:hypothetical protein
MFSNRSKAEEAVLSIILLKMRADPKIVAGGLERLERSRSMMIHNLGLCPSDCF